MNNQKSGRRPSIIRNNNPDLQITKPAYKPNPINRKNPKLDKKKYMKLDLINITDNS